MRLCHALAGLLIAALGATGAGAQTAEEVLERLLTEGADAVTFSQQFRDQVSVETVQRVLDRFRDDYGEMRALRFEEESGAVIYDGHRLPVSFALNDAGEVALLRFDPAERIVGDLAEAVVAFHELGADVAWLATREGEVLSAQDADAPLAVGSAYKLGVLSVLVADIEEGARDWADVVRIADADRSLPSGRMQDFPADAPVTLHTAALAMIAESDNTGADLLTRVLGRDRVAERLGIAAEDFLTTREFFGLKADADLRARWREAEAAERPALAREAAGTLPDAADVMAPYTAGVEWEIPLERLCALIEPLADEPLMQVNPGPLRGSDWARVAYKGGSETGVVNFTAFLRDPAGQGHCLALTVNDPEAVSLEEAAAAFRTAAGALRLAP
ncbi:serine hydrolase [Salipiger mucosus]|uniref:Beta-lactamase related protein n=1 Tax=Salipiger mucosus DSM 16094 TaxID=1123237 RepID=S9S0E8_9RHOB|nr:serine hydrolase [Salipiger mucosus]EPX79709.1 beta-lactamase related protein [Salipiger mucosus DSM 16094]